MKVCSVILSVSPILLTLSGQMQQVCLHVLYIMLEDVTVELKHSQDVLGERSWYQIAPVHHLADNDTNHWREKKEICSQRKLFLELFMISGEQPCFSLAL